MRTGVWRVPLVLALLAVAASAGATPALVRASSRSEAVAVVLAARGGGGSLWIATDGAHFVRHDVPAERWVLDAHVDATGQVLLATTDVPRGGPILLSRFGAQPFVDRPIAGSESQSDAWFVEGRGRLALVTADGAFASVDGGLTFSRQASWEVDTYAFYAASARLDPDGAVDVLAPTFNTCGSSDLLEELTRLRARPGGRVLATGVPFATVDFPIVALLAADGALITLVERGDSCVVRVDAADGARDLRRAVPDCWLLGGSSPRFTVVVAGSRVIRLAGLSSQVLGVLPGAAAVRDVAPDARGRALVLLDDHRVVRYSARAEPEVVFAEP